MPIRVGRAHVKIDAPAHTKGVAQGNAAGAYEKQVGHHLDCTSDARRSTGVRPTKRDPILHSMPNLSPG